ncbi:MAG TPA: amidohydrolase family protein [Planctomycetota bacterium]|nr:amidohydrolase family protein [Planctomycetota bacterium]
MRRPHFALAFFALSCLAACHAVDFGKGEEAGIRPFEPRRLLITGETIRIGAPDWTIVRALLVEDGRVVAVGDEATARAQEPLEHLDLGKAVALPGLIDAHGHLEGLGRALEEIDLRGVESYPALIARVAARAAEVPPGTWIQGRGWDQNLWPERAFPHHRELSSAVPAHPVLLERVDGHAILVNARALELAKLASPQPGETPVAGGRMLLDARHEPTGVFVDNATELVERWVPPPDMETRRRRMLRGAGELAQNGVTGLHDMGEDLAAVRILAILAMEGDLPIEVAGYLSQSALESLGSGQPLPAQLELEYRQVGAKLYMDGALGSRGAALFADYSDEPGQRGLALLEPERLDALLASCDERGLQPAVHAIGDLANRRVLDAYERRRARSESFANLRPRIEHAQVVAPEDWARFAALGVVPSMQPTHATSDMPWAPARLGPERVAGAYAWRRLDPDGHALAFGSDCPVELCDPLAGIYAAITCADRKGEPRDGYRPDQRLDAKRALAAFTLNAARAARQEADFGTLAPGHFANLTVLDVDPLTAEPRALLGGGHVRMTIVRGEVVYRAILPPMAGSTPR